MSPDKFFTIESLASVGGCATLVWFVVNGLRRFFGLTMPWLFLLVSLIVNGVIFFSTFNRAPTLVEGLLLIGNTFVVGLAALGLQEAAVRGPSTTGGAEQQGRRRVGWLSSWLS